MTETNRTGVVTATGGGRGEGSAASADGPLDLILVVPEPPGGKGRATNPGRLLAADRASRVFGAVGITAARRTARVRDVAVVAGVARQHRHEQGEYGLSAVLRLETAGELGAGAPRIRPRSTALAIPATVGATAA
ncbi:Ohr subfamily peroxiredoxin [Streptomyces sp. NPDC008238]